MGKTVKARFSKGLIRPLEKLDLKEGKEIVVTILEILTESDGKLFNKAAGVWKGTIDAEELIKNIYADRLIQTRPEVKIG